MRKLNVTDGQTDVGRCNISRPGPSAPREIISFSYVENINIFGYLGAWGGGGGGGASIIRLTHLGSHLSSLFLY